MSSSRALQTPEIFLLIIAYIDTSTLLILRLTNRRINSITVTHQKFIFNSIASREYSLNLELATSEIPHLSDIFYLNALVRLPKARLLTVRGLDKGADYMMFVTGIRAEHPVGEAIRARCARGILLVWAMVDIQRSVDPSGPTPKYVPAITEDPVVPARSCRRRIIARLFKSRAAKPASGSTPTSPSASEVKDRLDMIDAAQQPFMAALDRDSRVDMELARLYLKGLMPFEWPGHIVGPFSDYSEKCWWEEKWALRQGPEFMLAVSSSDRKERKWAQEWVDAEWSTRPEDVAKLERIRPVFSSKDTENSEISIMNEAWEMSKKATDAYVNNEFPRS